MASVRTRRLRRQVSRRAGFTLVEMLISVTLVLLMMTMFTAIFQMATESVSAQKGIAQNNQKARALVTSLKGDFSKRTFRYALPFVPGEDPSTSPSRFSDRSGYLYISTNDPDSWQDVLIQFTANVNLTQEETDDTPYYGSAKLLYDLAADISNAPRLTNLRSNPNQPDADEGDLDANNLAASSAAEISYFVRNGNLYRRVMLLREPLPVAGEDLAVQPNSTLSGNDYKVPIAGAGGSGEHGGVFAYVNVPLGVNQLDSTAVNHFALDVGDDAPGAWDVRVTNDFWAHFDYSAVPVPGSYVDGVPTDASFVGIDMLDNTLVGGSIGYPGNRFGFNPFTGFSREHDGTAGLFIGRFTQAETSALNFNWPLGACRQAEVGEIQLNVIGGVTSPNQFTALNAGAVQGTGNPLDLTGTPLNLDTNTGVITEFQSASGRGGTRRVEDLLLANVHGLKVEIWDDRLQKFVQPGHNEETQILDAGGNLRRVIGDYHISRRTNGLHGPGGPLGTPTGVALNRVFDTWYNSDSSAFYDYNGDMTANNFELAPPFVAYRYYPPQQGSAVVTAGGTYAAPCGPGPTPNSAPNPYAEYDAETGVAGVNKGYWVGSDFTSAMAPIQHDYNVGDIVFARYGDTNGNGAFDWSTDDVPQFQIAYRCIQAGYAGDPNDYGVGQEPSWPRVPGQKLTETPNALATGTPAIWESLDNRRPLRSIRVTVQFFDQSTENLRQTSIVLPLTTDR